MMESSFSASVQGDTVIAAHSAGEKRLLGFFCTTGKGTAVSCDLPEGDYVNLIDGKCVRADQGMLLLDGEPVILKV